MHEITLAADKLLAGWLDVGPKNSTGVILQARKMIISPAANANIGLNYIILYRGDNLFYLTEPVVDAAAEPAVVLVAGFFFGACSLSASN